MDPVDSYVSTPVLSGDLDLEPRTRQATSCVGCTGSSGTTAGPGGTAAAAGPGGTAAAAAAAANMENAAGIQRPSPSPSPHEEIQTCILVC
eukprot:SAG22_NODE_8598_length_640_cov_1.062615_1_plen_91_part_00